MLSRAGGGGLWGVYGGWGVNATEIEQMVQSRHFTTIIAACKNFKPGPGFFFMLCLLPGQFFFRCLLYPPDITCVLLTAIFTGMAKISR